MSVVASALKPGTFAISNCGIGQLMAWKPSGPKGIFIGMAGLPVVPGVDGALPEPAEDKKVEHLTARKRAEK